MPVSIRFHYTETGGKINHIFGFCPENVHVSQRGDRAIDFLHEFQGENMEKSTIDFA